jgi:8-oxo-dGTP pyrophosphatase MutT (NUDIX family)
LALFHMLMGPQSHEHLAERVRKLFGTVPLRLQVAALPWREQDGNVEIMLITSRDTGRWVLPKGWPEAREPLCNAAAREAGEEAGLSGTISPFEAGRYFYAKALPGGEEVPCEVLVFPLQVADVAERWKEKHARKRRWVACAEAERMVAERDLAQIIAHFCANRHQYTV